MTIGGGGGGDSGIFSVSWALHVDCMRENSYRTLRSPGYSVLGHKEGFGRKSCAGQGMRKKIARRLRAGERAKPAKVVEQLGDEGKKKASGGVNPSKKGTLIRIWNRVIMKVSNHQGKAKNDLGSHRPKN